MKNMLQLFKEGDVIYGYCNGAFGRDDYEDKVCVKVTPYYAVFEYLDEYENGATVINFSERFAEIYGNSIEEWRKESNSYD